MVVACCPSAYATAQATYRMLANQTLWDTAVNCHAALETAGIPHAVAGGVAVCLHGYRRNTVDLDLLARQSDQSRIREALEASGYAWSAEQAEFRGPSGVPVRFLLSGERAGQGAEVLLPDPDSPGVTVELEGLPVLSLARLIECMKTDNSPAPIGAQCSRPECHRTYGVLNPPSAAQAFALLLVTV